MNKIKRELPPRFEPLTLLPIPTQGGGGGGKEAGGLGGKRRRLKSFVGASKKSKIGITISVTGIRQSSAQAIVCAGQTNRWENPLHLAEAAVLHALRAAHDSVKGGDFREICDVYASRYQTTTNVKNCMNTGVFQFETPVASAVLVNIKKTGRLAG